MVVHKKSRKNVKNISKLFHFSNSSKPVALLKCHFQSTHTQGKGNDSVSRSHFLRAKNVLQIDLCVRAPVAINGMNILPEVGLYNGAREL